VNYFFSARPPWLSHVDVIDDIPSDEACTYLLDPDLAAGKFQPLSSSQARGLLGIGGAEFVALSNAAPGFSNVDVFANFERIQEDAGGVLTGPYSDLIVNATVLNLALGTTEAVHLGYWTSAPEGIDAVYGSEVSTAAEFQCDTEQKRGVQVLKVRVRGSDGFKETIRAEVPQTQGFRFKADPNPGIIRFLSDGPGGSHPAYAVALELDAIPIGLLVDHPL
jgi:hypothetical protein